MIRVLIVTFLCFSFSINDGLGQISFVKSLNSAKEEIPFCIKQMGLSYFLSLRSGEAQWDFWNDLRLLKINDTGEIAKELFIHGGDSSYFNIHHILPINNSELLVVGGCKQTDIPCAQLWIMRIDTSLNIIWDKKYFTNKICTSNIAVTEGPTGNLIIAASITNLDPMPTLSLIFLEINSNGDSLQSKCYSDGNPLNTDVQSIICLNGQYKAFVFGYQSYLPPNSSSQILQLDSDLNLVEVRAVPNQIEGYRRAEKINENMYYLTGKAFTPTTHYDVAIAKLNDSEGVIHYNHTGKSGYTPDYSAWMKCMSLANSNSIYSGGTGNYNGSFYSCNTPNKVLILSNYDSLLNCRWTRFYGNDTACYTLSTMDATSDGGCIMGSMYYSPSHPENLLDAVIIKVDSLGLFTGMPENAVVPVHEALVFPNPGQDFLTVQSGPQINGACFKMFDASGILVKDIIISSTLEKVNASKIPSGTYLWQIVYKGKIVEKGKWLKQ